MYGHLVPLHQPGNPGPIPLTKKDLLVGRHPACDITLAHRSVSRRHCEMILNEGHWTIRDLNSHYGTKINGIKVGKTRLNPGDIITLAQCIFELKYSPSALGSKEPQSESDVQSASDIMKWAFKKAQENNVPE